MGEYMLEQKVKLLCGPGKASEIGSLAAKLGKKKALLVTDKGIVATGIHNRVVDSLEQAGVNCVVLTAWFPTPLPRMWRMDIRCARTTSATW